MNKNKKNIIDLFKFIASILFGLSLIAFSVKFDMPKALQIAALGVSAIVILFSLFEFILKHKR